ncbi:hypothetical protein SAMN04489716_4992 [Actinoplanes derwentensis]|uniref:Exo-alpha-sialidase n=1 Tax=Actinoplanes derwentensis TaxID=113562 RepID=A0A1H2BXA3_9ACTN|nr:hypothetical protein Ade03nite_21110 [Actinoplanes derwentensis]SDT62878.1 hypothetical protein SAMN04489716_4992 [Actinoplanes derwentensis]
MVGGVREVSGETRPALWSSADAVSWRPMGLEPVSFYGGQSVLSSVACSGRSLVLLGAKSGGVHGNPRVSSWVGPLSGPVREVSAPFELFGGPDAVNAGRTRTGAGQFLIVGNRASGASVWSSPDGAAFVLRPGAGVSSWASDAVASGSGWLVVGAASSGGVRRPAVWSWAVAAGWSAVSVDSPGSGELFWAGPVLLGVSDGFRAWRPVGGRWVAGPAFGVVGPGVPPVVSGAVAAGRLFALTGSGDRFGLSVSADSGGTWAGVDLPAPWSRSVDTVAAVAGSADRLVLLRDGGSGARVYMSDGPFGRFR